MYRVQFEVITVVIRNLIIDYRSHIPEDAKSVRYSAKNFAGLRKRLKLSADKMGAVIGVGAQTVYNWATGKTRPRKEQIAVIAGLRKLCKKEAASLLDR